MLFITVKCVFGFIQIKKVRIDILNTKMNLSVFYIYTVFNVFSLRLSIQHRIKLLDDKVHRSNQIFRISNAVYCKRQNEDSLLEDY